MIELTLPWPPSVNGYWRSPSRGPLAGRHMISKRGREYRKAAALAVSEQWKGEATDKRLAVAVRLCSPTRRKYDLDNMMKGLLDALTYAGVWQDDGQIDRLTIERGDVEKPGGAIVTVEAMP